MLDDDDFNELNLSDIQLRALIRAHGAVVRLDEQVARSSVGRAWSERILFRQACDAQLGQGCLVGLEELVLAHGGVRRTPGYPELIDTLQILRAWRCALDEEALDLLRAERPGVGQSAIAEPFPVLRAAVTVRGFLKEPSPSPAPEIDVEKREAWRRVWRKAQAVTPLLAAALVWDSWTQLVPEPGSGWRGTLLAALMLRALGVTSSFLLPIDCGWRVSAYRVRPRDTRVDRLVGFVSWMELAATEARKDLVTLSAAHIQLRHRLRHRRRNSRLPGLARLLVSLPLVSLPLAARHLGCSSQAVGKMMPLLGSLPRLVSDDVRYRVWTVP